MSRISRFLKTLQPDPILRRQNDQKTPLFLVSSRTQLSIFSPENIDSSSEEDDDSGSVSKWHHSLGILLQENWNADNHHLLLACMQTATKVRDTSVSAVK
jgi:hypothetical protein